MLLAFFQKYKLKEILFAEINGICTRIHNNIQKMASNSQLIEWCNAFHAFVDSVIAVSKKRLE